MWLVVSILIRLLIKNIACISNYDSLIENFGSILEKIYDFTMTSIMNFSCINL